MRKIFSKYLSAPAFAILCSDEAFVEKMLLVEMTIAKAQAKLGIIPEKAAKEIVAILDGFSCDMEELADSTLNNGIPTIGLLAQARKVLPRESADYLHWGVTSQDISDTSLVLILKEVSIEIEKRLKRIVKGLEKLQSTHGAVSIVARTRNQMAVPITFSKKVDSWKKPLQRHLARIAAMRPRIFCLQLAGSDGMLSHMGNKGIPLRQKVAEALDLDPSEVWHNQRDQLVEFADVLCSAAASLAKMGTDVLTMVQTEVGEVSEGPSGGGSSSMPHKCNPVRSEALVALAWYATQLATSLKQSQIHKNERDGSALCLEWLVWPQLVEAVGASLEHAVYLAENMQVHPEVMQKNIERQQGLLHSERATYILARRIGRSRAKSMVADACKLAQENDIHLAIALKKINPDLDVDWSEELK